eukprot:scaffold34518_cov62-Phaeocystis_antarctica.AAC.2
MVVFVCVCVCVCERHSAVVHEGVFVIPRLRQEVRSEILNFRPEGWFHGAASSVGASNSPSTDLERESTFTVDFVAGLGRRCSRGCCCWPSWCSLFLGAWTRVGTCGTGLMT